MMLSCLLFLALCGQLNADFDWDTTTPLDDYVNRDDGFYEYSEIERYEREGFTMIVLNMTSQKWMDETVTLAPIWTHHLSIAIPDEIVYPDAAHLYVGGGNMDNEPPTPESESRMAYIAEFAVNTGAVAAYLKQVPNQPCFFTDTPNIPRTEDMIIARTWRYYIEEIVDDPDVCLLLPMTKAGKKAIDTVVEVVANERGNTIDKIMPAGFSKRGWVTWLLGATDPRVFAMVPIVLDIGNWHENLHHHFRAYGGWSWAFTPYWNEEVSRYIDHPRSIFMGDELAMDPMRYNSRLTMPKMVVIGTGDQFFLPDDSHYFFDDLTPPKFMLLNENMDHSVGRPNTTRLNHVMRSFFVAGLEGFTFPEISWTREEHGSHGELEMLSDTEPLSVTAWWGETTDRTCSAYNNTEGEEESICRRDFRLQTARPPGANDILWEETDVEDLGNARFRVTMDYRDDEEDGPGFRGFFMSMVYPGFREGDELHFTTEVHIIPDVLPYDRCSSEEECLGSIV